MKLRYLAAAMAGLLVVAAPAAAQELGQARQRERGYVIGFGGQAWTAVTSPFYGASAGANVTRNLQVIGEFGRMQDLYATFTRDDLRVFEQETNLEGIPFSTTFKMPATFATGGVRLILSNRYRVRPYLSGGAGMAWLNPKPTFMLAGLDVTSAIRQTDSPLCAESACDAIIKAFERQTKPMAVVGGGVAFDVVEHFTVHLGYRYSRIFVDTNYLQDTASPHSHKGFDVHRAYLGAGFSF